MAPPSIGHAGFGSETGRKINKRKVNDNYVSFNPRRPIKMITYTTNLMRNNRTEDGHLIPMSYDKVGAVKINNEKDRGKSGSKGIEALHAERKRQPLRNVPETITRVRDIRSYLRLYPGSIMNETQRLHLETANLNNEMRRIRERRYSSN